MIHPWQEKTGNQLDNRLVFPAYDGLSFANIPGTILNFFGLKSPNPPLKDEILGKIPRNDKIALFLIDGLGFLQWEKYYMDIPFLKTVSESGEVFSLTSTFPSTTPAAITTMNSGLLPSEHGLLEWFLYLEEIDQVIQTLPFMGMDETTPDSLSKKGVNPEILFNGETIYQKLSQKNIRSYAFLSKDYADSSYNKVAFKGTTIVPFASLKDLFRKFCDILARETSPSYFYVYWGELDSVSHLCGPYSGKAKDKLNNFSDFFIKVFNKKELKGSTILVTADHGQIDIDSRNTIMLNSFPALETNLALSSYGKKILPSGNVRDVFLKIKEEKLNDTKIFLQEKLKNQAKIIEITKLLKMGVFGNKKPSEKFYNRIGNLLILPTGNNTVWYGDISKKPNFLGHHGGLSKEEMLIPFGIIKPS